MNIHTHERMNDVLPYFLRHISLALLISVVRLLPEVRQPCLLVKLWYYPSADFITSVVIHHLWH